jgi:short-subunit dehydrogenase
MELQGAHVLLTGGSRGIGLALAQELAAAGADLTLVARGRDELNKAAADVGGRALPCDLGDPAAVDGLVERAEQLAGRPVDVVVLNAGTDAGGTFAERTADELQQLWQLNVASVAELIRQAQIAMTPRGSSGRRSHLVVISSLSAQVAMPGMEAYAASKAAVSQLVTGLRRDLRRDGIGTTLVELNQVRTGLYAGIRQHPPAAKAFDRAVRLRVLRDLTTDEVAKATVDAIRRDKQLLVLPKRARFQSLLSKTPQLVAERLLGMR